MIYSAKILVYGSFPHGTLHKGFHLIRGGIDDSNDRSKDRNVACYLAKELAKELCKKLGGKSASYYLPDHWNNNMNFGFTK